MSMPNENPYESPMAESQPASPYGLNASGDASIDRNLASRGSRFGAAMIDALIGILISVPFMFATGYLNRAANNQLGLGEIAIWTLGGIAIYMLLHGYLLATQGQSIGKMLVGIRIVDYHDNQILPLGKLVGLRLLPVWIVSVIPMIGGILGLVDVLFIFGEEKRCVHDLIAGTKVVQK